VVQPGRRFGLPLEAAALVAELKKNKTIKNQKKIINNKKKNLK
jgi:hypothetical protein